jgi:hypothetical protein
MAESDEQIRKHLRLRRVTKKSAAISQLESAILLWLNNGDVVSIHALAVASNECFHAIGKLKNKPSRLQERIASDSPGMQKAARRAQNFFKHGWKDLKGSVMYSPLYGEMLMFDSVVCYEVVFGAMTPLMRTFATQFVIENQEVLTEGFFFLLEGLDVDNLRKLDRPKSASQLLKIFEGATGNAA